MAGGPHHAGIVGGGEDIPPRQHAPGRLTRAAGSVGLAAGLVAWVAGHPGRVAAGAALAPAGVGIGLLVTALTLRRPRLLTASITLLGAGYLATRIGQPVDGSAAWYGALLLVVAELAFWSLELPWTGPAPPAGHRRRWLFIASVTVASAALAGAVLVAGASAPGGAGWEVTGAAAAVAVLGLVAGLGRRGHHPGEGEPAT